MDEETKKQLTEQYKSLPREVQQAITDTDLPKKFQQIVQENKLLIDQAGILETETILVLYGIEPLENFVVNISRELNLPKDKAMAIARSVDELIFKSVRSTLREINQAVIAADNEAIKTPSTPSKEETLAGIENPQNITKEASVSLSSLTSNNAVKTKPDETIQGIEIRKSMLPEINPEAMLPMKTSQPVHENIPPVQNIVATKMTETVIVPKQTITVEEKTKLPEKPKSVVDAYREPIN